MPTTGHPPGVACGGLRRPAPARAGLPRRAGCPPQATRKGWPYYTRTRLALGAILASSRVGPPLAGGLRRPAAACTGAPLACPARVVACTGAGGGMHGSLLPVAWAWWLRML